MDITYHLSPMTIAGGIAVIVVCAALAAKAFYELTRRDD